MKKFLCLIAAAVLCLSLAACTVDSQPEEKNFGMEFAEAYAKLDLNELSKLISADVSLEPFREIMEFDRGLKALGTLTLIPVNSVAVQNRFEIKIRANLSLDGEIYSHVNTYYLSYEREGSKRFATDLELVGLRSQAEDLLDGLDAYIKALGSGDFVRAVALTDMSEASSSAREETIAQLYRLTVVDPMEISLKSRQLSDGSLRARLEIDGTEADFVVLYRQQENGGYTYSLRPCLVDLSTPKSTCESFFAALGRAELQQLLMTVDADLLTEEELTELHQLMETLRALVDSGVTVEFANVTLEPLSEGADSFTGILTGDLVIYAYEAESISLSMKVGLIRRGESWLITDMQPNIDLSSPQSAGDTFFRTLVGADSVNLLLCLDAEMSEQDMQYVTGLLGEFASLNADAAITVNSVELEVLDSDEYNLSGVLRGSISVSDRIGTEEKTLSFDLEMVCREGAWLIRGVCAHTDPPVGPDLSTPEHTAESFFEALTGADSEVLSFTLDEKMSVQDTQYVMSRLAEFERLNADAAITVDCVDLEVFNSDEYNLSGILRGTISVSDRIGTEEKTFSFDLEMVCREGDWLIWGAGSHVEYDQSVIPDFSSASKALYSYFDALNTYSADCILGVFCLYDLSAEQVSYVRKTFGIISEEDAEQELFYEIIDFIALFEEDDYVEYQVTFSQKVDGYVVRKALVLLDFVWTEYGWRMLPENYIYDQNGSRPDYSALSPKYGAIHYLDVLPCGDYERILSCFSLEGLSEGEKESFRKTIRDYSLNTWYTYVFQYVSYLEYGPDTAQIEVAYLWNGIEKRIAFTMVKEDGVWKILAKSQPHMYVSDSL